MSATESGAGERVLNGVRCQLCGVVRVKGIYSHHGVIRCQDWYICEQVVALVEGARSTYADLIEAGWEPATPDADDASEQQDGPSFGDYWPAPAASTAAHPCCEHCAGWPHPVDQHADPCEPCQMADLDAASTDASGAGEHYPTTPVQCACGWRETAPGAGTWLDHMGSAAATRARAEGKVEAWREAIDLLFTIDATENGIGSAQRELAQRIARSQP